MILLLQEKLDKDPKMSLFLKQNSYWYKYLNRNSDYYEQFVNDMKNKYHLRITDKFSAAIDNIELVNSILENIK